MTAPTATGGPPAPQPPFSASRSLQDDAGAATTLPVEGNEGLAIGLCTPRRGTPRQLLPKEVALQIPMEGAYFCALPLHCRNCRLRPLISAVGVEPIPATIACMAASEIAKDAGDLDRRAAEEEALSHLPPGTYVSNSQQNMGTCGYSELGNRLEYQYLLTEKESGVIVADFLAGGEMRKARLRHRIFLRDNPAAAGWYPIDRVGTFKLPPPPLTPAGGSLSGGGGGGGGSYGSQVGGDDAAEESEEDEDASEVDSTDRLVNSLLLPPPSKRPRVGNADSGPPPLLPALHTAPSSYCITQVYPNAGVGGGQRAASPTVPPPTAAGGAGTDAVARTGPAPVTATAAGGVTAPPFT